MRDPLISIITVNYNNVQGLRQTLNSVERQTYTNIEWIFIDGGSTDGSQEIADKAAFVRKKLHSGRDGGVYDAMNRGIDRVDPAADYVVFMNSGDVFASADVLELVAPLLRSGASMICGASVERNALFDRSKAPRRPSLMFLGMIAHHQAVFFSCRDRSRLQYDVQYRIAADYDLMCRYFAGGCQILLTDVCVAVFGMPGISLSKVHRGRLEAYRIRRRVLRLNPAVNVLIYIAQSLTYAAKRSIGYFGR